MTIVGLGQAKSEDKRGTNCLQIFSVAPGCPGIVSGTKNWGIMGKGQKIGIFHFSQNRPAGHMPLQADLALSTRQAIDVHIGAARQCTDAIEAGVMHTYGYGKRGSWANERRGRGCLCMLAVQAEPLVLLSVH